MSDGQHTTSPDLPWYHFAGVAGSGMSALAQFHVMQGGRASGSDRAFDRLNADSAMRADGGAAGIRRHLLSLGIDLFPQDGSAFSSPRTPDALVVSTAVEESVPDVRAARERGALILHRSELLARIVARHRTIAVTGTSGKSTVTAMIFEILEGAGLQPSVLTGGEIVSLKEQGLLGNARAGRGNLLVIEADESDGSLVRYEPWVGVLLNLQRDHKEPEELAEIFRAFRTRTRGPFVCGEEANLDPFASASVRFGFGAACRIRATAIEPGAEGSRFRVSDAEWPEPGERAEVACALPVPGLYNIKNALAAMSAALCCGVSLEQASGILRRFRGVARRFQRAGMVRGIEVIDDFAHNPDKIAAALVAARGRGKRILAVFQPHGFGPTRFLRDALIDSLSRGLTATDRLYLPEIFYAGGTAVQDISSREIAEAVAARGVPAMYRRRREDLLGPLLEEARSGDVLLVMGARDPSLSEFCAEIVRRLETGK